MKKVNNALTSAVISVKSALSNTRGEAYVDTGLKILIAVVIGALLLAGLYALFNETIMPTVVEKVEDLFGFTVEPA